MFKVFYVEEYPPFINNFKNMKLLLCGEEVLGWGWEEREGKWGMYVCTYRVGPYIFYFFTFKEEGGRNEMSTKGGLLGRP